MSLAVLALKLLIRAAVMRIWQPDTYKQHLAQARELNATARALCAEATTHRTTNRVRDIYDLMPLERACTLRRQNKERLAHLEAAGALRRQRLRRAAGH